MFDLTFTKELEKDPVMKSKENLFIFCYLLHSKQVHAYEIFIFLDNYPDSHCKLI